MPRGGAPVGIVYHIPAPVEKAQKAFRENVCTFRAKFSILEDAYDGANIFKQEVLPMIRAFFAICFVVLYCIVSIPVLLVETLIRRFRPLAAETSMLRIVQWAFRILLWICGTKVTLIGHDNIPDGEPVLFVGNHQSFFDIIISYSQMKGRCGYIAKNNLEHIPILSWNMRFLFCLFLDRNDLKQGLETIRRAIDYIKNGISVFIYPEGSRNKAEDKTQLQPFHRGSFKIAQRTGCRIVPVAFNNTAEIFENHFPKVKPVHVIVEYGAPVAYGDLTREEQKHIDEYFHDILEGMVRKNEAQV